MKVKLVTWKEKRSLLTAALSAYRIWCQQPVELPPPLQVKLTRRSVVPASIVNAILERSQPRPFNAHTQSYFSILSLSSYLESCPSSISTFRTCPHNV